MADLLRERIDRAVDAQPSETSSAKQSASDDEECEVSPAAAPRDGTLDSHEAALVEQVAARITTGAPFTERKSTFQVCLCNTAPWATLSCAASEGALSANGL